MRDLEDKPGVDEFVALDEAVLLFALADRAVAAAPLPSDAEQRDGREVDLTRSGAATWAALLRPRMVSPGVSIGDAKWRANGA